jgi:hypothetical protein
LGPPSQASPPRSTFGSDGADGAVRPLA